MKLYDQTAQTLKELIASGHTSPQAVQQAVQERAQAINPRTNAFLRFYDLPCTQHGTYRLPIGLKDNLSVKNQLVGCASRILEGYRAPYNAHVVERLLESGAILQGALNMDEFAFGSSTETSSFGPARNPWDTERVPGGSSGGSAAAVAAGQTVWALGSDTGGSIRQPASFCGIVGLKPTYGRISRYGLVAFGSSLDQIGPLTKDVTDSALLLNIISGFDPKDSTSANCSVPDYTQALTREVKGLRIGIPKEYFIDGIQPEVLNAVQSAIKLLERAGAQVKDISLAHTKYAVATYYILATAEASSNLARFDGVKYGHRSRSQSSRQPAIIDLYETTREQGFGDEAKRRIMLGTYVLSSGYYDAFYLRAQKVRTLIKRDFEQAFNEVDVIVSPTAPSTAFRLGEKINDPLSMYLSDIFTIPANLAGIPAISLPCGFDSNQLPVGLQFMAAPFAEETLLRTAFAYEQATPWHTERARL